MPTRTRSSGSRTTGTQSASLVVTTIPAPGPFRLWDGSSWPSGIHPGSGQPYVRDTRCSITDVTGNAGGTNSCNHSIIEIDPPLGRGLTVSFRNVTTPLGPTVSQVLTPGIASYYMDQMQTLGHLSSVATGLSIAINRIPDFGPAQLDGLVSLYEAPELFKLRAALKRIPVHIMHAMFRARPGSLASQNARRDAIRWISERFNFSKRHPVATAKGLIGADLAWKFGIEPFLKDINTIHSALGSLDSKIDALRRRTFTARGKYTGEGSSSTTHFSNQNLFLGALKETAMSTRTTRVTSVAGSTRKLNANAFAHIDALKLAAFRESLGLHAKASTLWAVVPYSFIVDWFLPICDFVESLGTNMPDSSWFTTTASWTSTKKVTEITFKHDVASQNRSDYEFRSGSGSLPFQDIQTGRFGSYVRTPGIPRNTPVHLPRPKLPLDWGKWWSLLEIAIQKL